MNKYRKMFESDFKAIFLIASNPATPASDLNEIYFQLNTEDIMKELAQNPNTSTTLLKVLAPNYINEILLNPVMPLLCLEGNTEIDEILLAQKDSYTHVYYPAISLIDKAPSWLENWIRSHFCTAQQQLAYHMPIYAASGEFNIWVQEKGYDIPF
jgi:hypothetical protein